MKIGIITFLWADNYGALLQAHALQSFLQTSGHEVEIVDYRPKQPGSLAHRWLSASPCGCARKWEAAWKRSLFERFRKTHLIRTPEVFHGVSELRKIADRFDLLIAGSDQVWNPTWLSQLDGLFDLYFLSFAGAKTRKISYAASIGHSDCSTLTPKWQHILADKMKAMDAISVREQSGVELVRQLCGRTDAVCVADPTLLVGRAHYERLAGGAIRRKPYQFVFMLHGLEEDAAPAWRAIAGQLNLKLVRSDAAKTALHAGYTLPSVEGWLRDIRDAKFVVTNSFHCTVFCLIFHVPFVAVLIEGKIGTMNSRITDLLASVGLSDRVVMGRAEAPGEIVARNINWDEVEQAVASMRGKAVQFLKNQFE